MIAAESRRGGWWWCGLASIFYTPSTTPLPSVFIKDDIIPLDQTLLCLITAPPTIAVGTVWRRACTETEGGRRESEWKHSPHLLSSPLLLQFLLATQKAVWTTRPEKRREPGKGVGSLQSNTFRSDCIKFYVIFLLHPWGLCGSPLEIYLIIL